MAGFGGSGSPALRGLSGSRGKVPRCRGGDQKKVFRRDPNSELAPTRAQNPSPDGGQPGFSRVSDEPIPQSEKSTATPDSYPAFGGMLRRLLARPEAPGRMAKRVREQSAVLARWVLPEGQARPAI